jgi:hypothetical protein
MADAKKEVRVLYGIGGYMCSHPSRDKEPVAADVEVCGDCAADVRNGAEIIRLILDQATGEWVPKQ